MRRHLTNVYWVAGFFSIALSCWLALQYPILNRDGICYLQSAQTIGLQGLHAGMALCGQAQWPGYSWLIDKFARITHLDINLAVTVLNSGFSLLSVLFFLRIVKQLGATPPVLWCAALTILFAHDFNILRNDVIRDHGYWAFYLASIWFFLAYSQNQKISYACGWGLSLVLATVFRIEGAIFLIFLPLCFVGVSTHKRKDFLQLNMINTVIGLIIFSWILVHPGQSLGRLSELQSHLLHGVTESRIAFVTHAQALRDHVLNGFAAADATYLLGVMLVTWLAVSVVQSLSAIYSMLLVYAGWQNLLTFRRPYYYLLSCYAVLNILMLLVFETQYMFLTKRYLVGLSLTLMLGVPFALYHLYRHRRSMRALWLGAVLAFTYSAIGGVMQYWGPSKEYLRQAGEWLAQHAAPSAKIYSNDAQVLYYSQHFGNTIFQAAEKFADLNHVSARQLQAYDYVALVIHDSEKSAIRVHLADFKIKPVQIFMNKRGDEVSIYHVSGGL